MGLTCSVLGHEYGEREHIEERDRQGSEEVIAIREVKTCERCGEELIVSESKEVLAVASDEEETEHEFQESTGVIEEPMEDPIERAETVEHESKEMDDGIILTDEPDDREPGEWPAMEEATEDRDPTEEAEWPEVPRADEAPDGSDPKPWPPVEGEDEGFAAATVEEDAEVAGQVLEATQDDSSLEETEAGFVRAREMDSHPDPDDDNVHTEFYCPRCDWSAKTLTTSVRRGDICPNCRTGYIAERDV